MYLLGALIAIGTALSFVVIGTFTLWSGVNTLRTEVRRDYLRTRAGVGTRLTTTLVVGLPLLIASVFSFLGALRMLQVALGLDGPAV